MDKFPKANAKAVLFAVIDATAELMYHDRKDDNELPPGSIEHLIAEGKLTVDQMVNCFRETVQVAVQEYKK